MMEMLVMITKVWRMIKTRRMQASTGVSKQLREEWYKVDSLGTVP